MATDHIGLQQAIAAAVALGLTDTQLYELARVAVAESLKNGAPTTTLSLPTGVSYTVGVDMLLARLPDLRRAAQVESGGGIAFAQGYLP